MKKIVLLSLLINGLCIINAAEQIINEDFGLDFDFSELVLVLEAFNEQDSKDQLAAQSKILIATEELIQQFDKNNINQNQQMAQISIVTQQLLNHEEEIVANINKDFNVIHFNIIPYME